MSSVVLLDLYKERGILDIEKRKEEVDLVVYSLLELLSAAEYLLGSGSWV